MFVYLVNFIVMFQPYYRNFFTFPSRLDYWARLFCGQGSIVICIQSVFNNETWNEKELRLDFASILFAVETD